jgi:dihydroorotate dehydrogenase
MLADDWIVPMMRRFLNPELAHKLALQMAILAPTYRPSAKEQRLNVAVRLWGDKHEFKNPIGLAAGYDKDATAMVPLLKMGFSFVEIGSVCLKAQPGNPSPRMFRLVEDEAIINRYGFNSLGADVVERHLKEFRLSLVPKTDIPWWQRMYDFFWPGSHDLLASGILGVNLGKNKTSTTALEDYQMLITKLGPYADYLVINVSSPNTPGLRDLQSTMSLERLLAGCQEVSRQLASPPPLLVKLSPDLSDEELKDIAAVLIRLKIDGIILTNTTTSRPPSLKSQNKMEQGGLSGKPLKQRSTECIRLLYEHTKGEIPIIGVGGVQNGHDAYEKLKAGASLVQVYSGMIYEGPGLVSKIRDELADLMIQNGQRNLQEEVVGLDHEDLHWQKQRAALAKCECQTTTLVLDQEDDDDSNFKADDQLVSERGEQ